MIDMWVLTKYGAFMPALRHEKDVAKGDNRLVQVRARRAVDLVALCDRFLENASGIVRNAGTDYEARVYCTHEDWANALAKMAMEIDYTSFKDTVKSDHRLHAAYYRVWNALYDTLGTRHAFDVKWTRTTTTHGRKGKKNRGRRDQTTTAERVDVLLREYETSGRRWWDEVEPIDVNDKNWER